MAIKIKLNKKLQMSFVEKGEGDDKEVTKKANVPNLKLESVDDDILAVVDAYSTLRKSSPVKVSVVEESLLSK